MALPDHDKTLGATMMTPTPDGQVQVTITPRAVGGRKLRLKSQGLPGAQGQVVGDLYAVLNIAVPPARRLGARPGLSGDGLNINTRKTGLATPWA